MNSIYINDDEEGSIMEPKDKLIRFTPKQLADVRKIYNLDNRANTMKSIAHIKEWIKQQDHFMKKEFSTGYIERSIATSKGSIELAKKQIDRICTFKTLMPKYFQTVDLRESEIMKVFKDIAYFAFMPKLTDEYYRVIIIKCKPGASITSHEYSLAFQFLCFIGEYFKNNDCCLGYIIVADFCDINASDFLPAMNLIELQHVMSILTEGYGCKLKGLYMVTGSKFIEGFLKVFRAIFSEKIGKRILSASTRKALRNLINGDVLPEEYGGTEKPIEELFEDLLQSLTGEPVQALMREMNKASTDESKRQTYKFNQDIMGMPGSFRTLSLD